MRMSHRLMAMLVPALGLVGVSEGAVSLRCVNTPAIELAGKSKAVFSGQVIDIKKSEGIEEVRFKVLKSWKHVRGDEVVLFNHPHHEAPHYQVGRTYLVFAGGDGNRLKTGMCSGVRDTQSAQNEIRQLDRWWRRNKSKRR